MKPPVLPDEEYIAKWRAREYSQPLFRENAPEYYSKRGERVRSKSELFIANCLNDFGVPYLYECPLHLSRLGDVSLDFTILKCEGRKEYLWEHFGMMDDPEYRSEAFAKLRAYEADGYFPGVNLIVTFETAKLPLNSRSVEQMIRQVLL